MALALMAAAPLLPASSRAAPAGRAPRICVIGAGIMGISIAYHLAGQGSEVVVLEQATPGSGATQGAFAMLIATHDEDRAFNNLYEMAILDWRRLELEFNSAIKINWGGCVTWTAPGAQAEALMASSRRLQSWGAPIQAVSTADIERLEPGIVVGSFGAGIYSPNQGALDPMQALGVLQSAARQRGVSFRYPCEVRGLERAEGRVTAALTADGPVAADVFVLASGVSVPALAAPLGVKAPIDVVSGTLAHSAPFPRKLRRILNGPQGTLKQDPDGRVVIGPDYRPGANGVDTSLTYGRSLLVEATRVIPALNGVRLESMSLGFVPIPKDTYPIVGFCEQAPNLYLALTMSGVTMAPLIGRLASIEIASGVKVETLAPYRSARFA